jgi:hypothetical protein
MPFKLSSTAFAPNGAIPSKFTCEGEDISPQLEWSGTPDGTRSLALIVDDPDAPDPAKPQRVYVHWVVYNISDSTTRIAENAGHERLGKADVRWAMSANRQAPVLLQALRVGLDTRAEEADEGRGGEGDGGAHPRPGGVDGDVRKEKNLTARDASFRRHSGQFSVEDLLTFRRAVQGKSNSRWRSRP